MATSTLSSFLKRRSRQMRVNVYAEELPALSVTTSGRDIAIVEKVVDGKHFYAIRLFLQSSPMLHNTTTDDDRSAITFWVPWTRLEGNDFQKLVALFNVLHYRACQLADSQAKKG